MFCSLSRRKPVTSGLSSSVLIACLLVAVTSFTTARDTDPKCKDNKKLCEEVENYPASIVEELLQKDWQRYMDMFEVDEPSIGERAARIDEESLCCSKERIIYPKAGHDKDHVKHFIVNHDKFRQGIRIEECSKPNYKCEMTDNFPESYKSACRQDYIFRSLLVYDSENNIRKHRIEIPSSCKCFVSNMHPPF